jgi:hypothetical protein
MRATSTFALACVVGLSSWSAGARADEQWLDANELVDPNYLPDQTSPPSIPDLTHRKIWLGLETNFASIKPHDAITGPQPRAFGALIRLEAEGSIWRRHWYLGGAYETAYGRPPGGKDGSVVYGYPEIWARGVWATRAGLAYGGGISMFLPLFQRSPSSAAASVTDAVRVVRPWDYPAFADNTVTAIPFVDARVIDGTVTLQLRQGFAFGGIVAEARVPSNSIVSHTTLYLGYRPIDELGLGLEVWEVYFLSASRTGNADDCSATTVTDRCIRDDQRGVFAASPSVRLLTRRFQPAFSLIFPMGHPLFDQVQSYWAARLTFGAILDALPEGGVVP